MNHAGNLNFAEEMVLAAAKLVVKVKRHTNLVTIIWKRELIYGNGS